MNDSALLSRLTQIGDQARAAVSVGDFVQAGALIDGYARAVADGAAVRQHCDTAAAIERHWQDLVCSCRRDIEKWRAQARTEIAALTTVKNYVPAERPANIFTLAG